MDSFKDVMARDISAAFLNVKEFADTYNIDGKNVLAVLDTDLVHERNKRSYAEFTEGVNQGQITLFVSRDDFTHLPVKDQLMVINGRSYVVNESADNSGVLEITLTINTNRGMPI
ncbi:sugar transporter [Salmonella enterica]|nr:sugar transporter [Salmonella enterica subsp. enterica serovar Edinburgh]EBH8904436.1 sugar transporter [Salmonella enterica subsp. enterica serovar 6,7:b:-]EHG2695398.1 sugar transporter [Salmonella enterica]EBH8946554.1 sugar transporter [Salmonella enterica subsp. enterica serovar 6,7:b:-]EHG2700120.1 sugar transporter [Salmonella enterica]